MDLRLNGLNPLSYQGVNAYSPPQFVSRTSAPTANDTQNFSLGAIWLYTNKTVIPFTQTVYMLVSLTAGVAIWAPLGRGTGEVTTLTGNDPVVVYPTAGGNINIVGDGIYITVTGTANTETISLINGGAFANSFVTIPATATATPVLGVLSFEGTGATTVSAAGSTITISSTAGTGTVTSLVAGNNISITGATPTVNPTVNVAGTTDHCVQLGNATNSLTSLTNGTTGQILTAVTGADPVWSAPATTYVSCAFQVYLGANKTNVTGAGTAYVVPYDTVVYDLGSNVNIGTGTFTAPVKGVYHISHTIAVEDLTAAMDQIVMTLRLTGTGPSTAQSASGCRMNPYVMRSANMPQWRMTASATLALDAGDTVNSSIGITNGAGDTATVSGGTTGNYITYINGFLVGLRL